MSIKDFFIYCGQLPWRKPLAMLAAVMSIIMICGAWITGRDIPDNALTALIWFDGVIFSWAYGTSSFEAVKEINKVTKKESPRHRGGFDESDMDNH